MFFYPYPYVGMMRFPEEMKKLEPEITRFTRQMYLLVSVIMILLIAGLYYAVR